MLNYVRVLELYSKKIPSGNKKTNALLCTQLKIV